MLTKFLQLTGLSRKWPMYTMEEVGEHRTSESLWIVADGSVYDVTHLLGRHPGGDHALLKRGGGAKDCAEDLMFHGRSARKDAQLYKIGEVSKMSTGLVKTGLLSGMNRSCTSAPDTVATLSRGVDLTKADVVEIIEGEKICTKDPRVIPKHIETETAPSSEGIAIGG